MNRLPKGFYLKTPRGKAVVVFSDWVYEEESQIQENHQRKTVYCEIRFLRGQQMVLGGAVLNPKDKDDMLHAAKIAFGRAVDELLVGRADDIDGIIKYASENKNIFHTMVILDMVSLKENGKKYRADYWQQFIAELRRQGLVK